MVHPQWGRGTVLFDKPHCIGVRFLEHGQVNFSPEEWTAQHSPPERFRGVLSKGGSGISDLEYSLQRAIDEGELSEDEALRLLERQAHPLEVRRLKRPSRNIDVVFAQYQANELHENDFYLALTDFAKMMVRQNTVDEFTFSNAEDAISTSLIEIWQRLSSFDPRRGSFRAFALRIIRANVRDVLRSWKASRGHSQHVEIDEESLGVVRELSAEDKILFAEWLSSLEPLNRTIVQLYMDGLTFREVGRALGMSHEGIRKRLNSLKLTTAPFKTN